MATRRTILRPSEVIYFTNISKEFPKCELRTIFDIEYCEFNQCLGSAFYDKLLADLVEYNCVVYDNTATYAIGDTVFSDGIIRRAIQATSGNPPSNKDYWENAPKFTTECLEKLWCDFLGPYLAWTVVNDQLPHINVKIAAAGLVKITGNGIETASKADYQSIQQSVLAKRERAFYNLDHYMKNNNGDGCFDEYKGIAANCCSDCGCLEDDCDCDCQDDCFDEKSDGYGYRFG